jgi:hypothetical protein
MTTPKTGKNPRGRPNRAEAERERLATIGIDPASIDVRRILASIAADTKAPAAARLSAIRELVGRPETPLATTTDNNVDDQISRMAVRMMKGKQDDQL